MTAASPKRSCQGVLANHDGDSNENVTKQGLMSRTVVLNARFESLYISLISSAKQHRKTRKS